MTARLRVRYHIQGRPPITLDDIHSGSNLTGARGPQALYAQAVLLTQILANTSLGKVHIDVKPFSIFGDHIVINEIIIDQPEFAYETKIIASNIGDLMKNIEAVTGGGAAKDAEPTAAEPDSEQRPGEVS